MNHTVLHPACLCRTAFLVASSLLPFVSRSMAADEKPLPDSAFTALGNGRDMSPFALVEAPATTWTVEGDIIRCAGTPRGYFATTKRYRNFVLRLDFRYARPADLVDDSTFTGNSGVLLYLSGEHKVWPPCVEVQGRNRDVGRIIAIGGATKVNAVDNPEARQRAIHPVGEWNSLEIVSRDGAVTATLNGALVCTSEAGDLREGQIGFQSEGAEIHFRNLRIAELP